jgi:coniferyl-aldehyde dehydrogenase
LLDQFVTLVDNHVAAELPKHSKSPDATGIITERHFDRLMSMIDEARKAGSIIIQPERQSASDRAKRRLPLTLIVDPNPDLRVMTEEIFGPLLPIVPYETLADVISHINAGERPLALYVYARDAAFVDQALSRTTSGGVCVNLCLLHGAIAALPFGGIGNSGMGRHHGIEGFREFSNPRGVLVRGVGGAIDAFNPPYRTLDGIAAQSFGPGSAASEKSV